MSGRIPASTRVIYIAGHGRSGSTLLDRLLGQLPDCVSVGELRQILDRGLRENQLCGCGEKFRDCQFWSAVIQASVAPLGPDATSTLLAAQRVVDRPDRFIKTGVLSPARFTGRFVSEERKVLAFLESLIRSISETAGCSTVVDSSKVPSYGLLLAKLKSTDLSVVHLVRDPRAVAFSLQRRRLRPEIHWREEFLPTYSPLRTAIRWCVVNQLTSRLSPRAKAYHQLKYEELANDPERSLDRISSAFDLPRPAPRRDGSTDANPRLAHTVSGNPIRMSRGPMSIRPDVEWLTAMSRGQILMITLAIWPWLLRYGYPMFPRRIADSADA